MDPLGEADVASVASLALPEGGAQAEHLRDQVTAAWQVERHAAPDMLIAVCVGSLVDLLLLRASCTPCTFLLPPGNSACSRNTFVDCSAAYTSFNKFEASVSARLPGVRPRSLASGSAQA